jgi:hypothetical protein
MYQCMAFVIPARRQVKGLDHSSAGYRGTPLASEGFLFVLEDVPIIHQSGNCLRCLGNQIYSTRQFLLEHGTTAQSRYLFSDITSHLHIYGSSYNKIAIIHFHAQDDRMH